MSYHNNSTKGDDIRGFEKLNPKIGENLFEQITFHDDGKIGYGGTRTQAIGGGGGGKSTLWTKFPRMSYSISGVSRNDFLASLEELDDETDPACKKDLIKSLNNHIKPVTSLIRGREYDTWNILTRQNMKKYYPDEDPRPLRIHIYKKSPLKFYEQDFNKNEVVEIKNLDVKTYMKMGELYDNLIQCGNNVIYPPVNHYLSQRLKDVINFKRNATSKRNKWGSYIDKNFLAPDTNYLAERDIFLIELFEYLYQKNKTAVNDKNFYMAIIDESHDLFRSNAPDIYYWIIEYMVDTIIEARKLNLSLVCFTHALGLVDYRILDRMSHFLWLPGSNPTKKYSVVDPRLTKKLKPGQGVIESAMTGKIGPFTFERIPKELSPLIVEGLTERKTLSSTISDDEFEAIPAEDG